MATLNKFTLVQISASINDKASVYAWAPSSYEQPGLSSAHLLLGVTMTDSDYQEQVAVMKRGYMRDVARQNGETWAVGDVLWATTNGSITKTRPTAPFPLVLIGVICETVGVLHTVAVDVREVPSLGELSGVSAETPADKDVFIYASGANVWEPRQIDHNDDLASLDVGDAHPQYQLEEDFTHPFLFMGGS